MSMRDACRFAALPLVAAALFAGVVAGPAVLTAQEPYHIVDHWKIGGEGGWDYLLVDSAAHRLYVTHGTRVEVLDATTGKLVGAITGLKGTHGIALDTAGKLGYISDGRANMVVVFDRTTLATVATIPAGTNPDGIVFEPATQTVWAFNDHSNNVTVIDAATLKAVATVALPGKPEFPVVDGQGTIFDNIEDKNEIVRLNAHTRTVTAKWAAGCESPSGLAFDVAGHRLFPVCDGNKMAVIDSNTGKILATPAIGDGPDAAGWDAGQKLAFASSGDGILSVIDAGAPGYPTIESLPTQHSARTMAYDSAADRIYLVAAEFGPAPEASADSFTSVKWAAGRSAAAAPATPPARPTAVPGSFTVIVVGRR
jgi:YVTN family beta-propeller protein